MEKLILKVLDEQIDGFITADQSAFRGCDIHEWFKTVNTLIDKGILRKRDCAGLAYEYNHKDLRKVIGAREFKQRVKTKLMQIDGNIKEDDLYFSQTTSGYYMEYKPKYPNRSNADFIVYQDLNGSISIHGNMSALVPTIEHYEDISDFEQKL